MSVSIELASRNHRAAPRIQELVGQLVGGGHVAPLQLGDSLPNLQAEQVGSDAIHWLRGFALHLERDRVAPPPRSAGRSAHDALPALRDVYAGKARTTTFAHLLANVDPLLYLPADFAAPLPVNVSGRTRLVGSSVRLLEELERLRAPLGVPASALERLEQVEATGRCEVVDDALDESAGELPGVSSPLGYDRWNDPRCGDLSMWLALHWLARQSVERQLAIVFA